MNDKIYVQPRQPDSNRSAETGRLLLGEFEGRRYALEVAESRWQKAWADAACSSVEDVPQVDKPNYSVPDMFPHPSGKMRMGQVRNYRLRDVVARHKGARGIEVMHPTGWDAFGLPAENAARERGIHPGKRTWEDIASMREELQRMGLSIDWAREFATCDPAYYGLQTNVARALSGLRAVKPIHDPDRVVNFVVAS